MVIENNRKRERNKERRSTWRCAYFSNIPHSYLGFSLLQGCLVASIFFSASLNHWLINEEFKVDTTFSFLSVISNVFSPSLTLDVDEDTSGRIREVNHDKRRLISSLVLIRIVVLGDALLWSISYDSNVFLVGWVLSFASNQDFALSSIVRRDSSRPLIVRFRLPVEDLSKDGSLVLVSSSETMKCHWYTYLVKFEEHTGSSLFVSKLVVGIANFTSVSEEGFVVKGTKLAITRLLSTSAFICCRYILSFSDWIPSVLGVCCVCWWWEEFRLNAVNDTTGRNIGTHVWGTSPNHRHNVCSFLQLQL